MRTDHILEEAMPDMTSQEEDSTLVSTKEALEKLGVTTPEEIVALDQTGPSQQPKTSQTRWRARQLRSKALAREELPDRKRKVTPQNQPSFKPLWDGEQLRQKLQSYDRTPFLDLLAVWMECTPNVQDIMLFAQKHPDRFIHSMTLLGKMGGFSEKKEIDVNLSAQVTALSDSQLEDRLRDTAYRLGIPLPKALLLKVIDAPSETVSEPTTKGPNV